MSDFDRSKMLFDDLGIDYGIGQTLNHHFVRIEVGDFEIDFCFDKNYRFIGIKKRGGAD